MNEQGKFAQQADQDRQTLIDFIDNAQMELKVPLTTSTGCINAVNQLHHNARRAAQIEALQEEVKSLQEEVKALQEQQTNVSV